MHFLLGTQHPRAQQSDAIVIDENAVSTDVFSLHTQTLVPPRPCCLMNTYGCVLQLGLALVMVNGYALPHHVKCKTALTSKVATIMSCFEPGAASYMRSLTGK